LSDPTIEGRIDPAFDLDERAMLHAYLDYHRATLVGKVQGLTQAQMTAQVIPSSSLTLAGLIKHLALVEDSWFTDRFAGLGEPEPWSEVDWDADPDWEFHTAVDDSPEELLALYDAACARSRAVFDAAPSLDDRSAATSRDSGDHFSLRWILCHMIEETARHNGHADLLREAIDGHTGE
jgi:uncharacterized damage-inducible protein DinB